MDETLTKANYDHFLNKYQTYLAQEHIYIYVRYTVPSSKCFIYGLDWQVVPEGKESNFLKVVKTYDQTSFLKR